MNQPWLFFGRPIHTDAYEMHVTLSGWGGSWLRLRKENDFFSVVGKLKQPTLPTIV